MPYRGRLLRGLTAEGQISAFPPGCDSDPDAHADQRQSGIYDGFKIGKPMGFPSIMFILKDS